MSKAKFDEAHAYVMEHEGSRDNNRFDPGGETLWGISRVYRPYVPVWPIYDSLIAAGLTPTEAAEKETIKETAKDWYRQAIWNEVWGGEMDSQLAANYAMDTGTNFIPYTLIKWYQENLNVLNNREKRWRDIPEDGLMGPTTIAIINSCDDKGLTEEMVALTAAERAVYRKKKARANSDKEMFVAGWVRRDFAFIRLLGKTSL